MRRVPRGAPTGFLVAGSLAVALVAVLTGLQVTIAALDETVYKFAAVQDANDFLLAALREHTSRGAARLYSLVVSPLFMVFEGDVAVRLARALNGVFFAATAIPVGLLARRVTASPWSAAAAGVLSVAVPWLTLATIMFSESLAYLLFACSVLAMVRAFEAPGPWRDALVLVLLVALIFTRVQFVVLLPAWVVLVAVFERAGWRRFPVTAACTAIAVVGAVGLLVVGVLSGRLRDLAGPYYDIGSRDTVPGNFGLGLLWEVEMLAVGVGLLPAVLAVAWFRCVLSERENAAPFRFAVIVLVLLGVLFAGTLWAQGGFQDFRSEERYFIYAIPLLWIAAVAAIERRTLPARSLVVGAIALSFVLVTVPVAVQSTGEQAFLGPVSMSLSHLLPRLERDANDFFGLAGVLSGRDILGLACLLVVGLAAVLWGRGTRARWLALVPAIALQLFIASYAFSGVHGKLAGIGGLTPDIAFEDLGWVDRETPGNPRIDLVDNQSEGREGGQRNTVFWNDEVTDIYSLGPMQLPSPGFPVFTLPTDRTFVTDDLRVGIPVRDLAVTAVDSPLWQLAAETVRTSPDGMLALVRPEQPGHVLWMAPGLDVDGHVTRGVELKAAGGQRVEVEVAGVGESQPARMRIELGDVVREVDGTGNAETRRRVRFDLCDQTAPVTGKIDRLNAADIGSNRFSAGRLMAVRLTPC